MRRTTAVALLLLVSCTEQSAVPQRTSDPPTPAPTQEGPPAARATIRLVADDDPGDQAYLEGLRFAVDQVTQGGELDLELLQAPSVEGALTLKPAAVVVIDDAAAVAAARPAIEQARTPVMLVGGDLYSSRQMFRYSFQTSIPFRWQASVIAHYLVGDRGYTSVAHVLDSSLSADTLNAVAQAIDGEGGNISVVSPIGDASSAQDAFAAAAAAEKAGVDAVIFLGSASKATELSHALSRLEDPPQLALSADALGVSLSSVPNRDPAPGTVACYTYAWSSWADMLPRIHSFRERFSAVVGHYPASLEQEGYEAGLALGEALTRTGGEGGDALVGALESFREETYASVPVRLGPDDHVLAEESHLGLFAIEEPLFESLPPGEASSLLPWRPILRTFTTDGEKMNFLDRDKKIFFPFWQPKRPTPKYWRSEYGIVSRQSDPLH